MAKLKDKVALVYDLGAFGPFAQALGGPKGFGEVLYFSPNTSFMSKSQDALVGRGLPGMQRIDSFWTHVDRADVIVFPDVGQGDFQHWLRENGYSVWGSGRSEMLELDRFSFRQLLQELGEPIPETVHVYGIDALKKELKDREDCWIKTSFFRGDFESHHFINMDVDEPWIDELALRIGPHAQEIEILIEEPIKGIEPGYDGYCVNGKFPKAACWGYEAKDSSYIGKAEDFVNMPQQIQDTTRALGMPLKTLGMQGNFHHEIRIGDDVYILDPCCRAGSPPIETLACLITNWPQIVYGGANGDLVEPEFAAKYGCQVLLKTMWVIDHFCSIDLPEEYEPFLQLRRGCRLKDQLWSVPSDDLEIIGSAVGIGDTPENAMDAALEIAKSVKGIEVSYSEDAKETLMDLVKEGTPILGQEF